MTSLRWLGLAFVIAAACGQPKDRSPSSNPTGSGHADAGSAPTDATPAVGSGSATQPTPAGFKVGDPVYGMWTNGVWYPGRIGKLNADGTYRVNYSDGDVSPSLPLKKVRVRKATAVASGPSSRSSASGNVCGSGYTNCNGSCVDLTSNSSHCGACGNWCRPGTSRTWCKRGVCDCAEHEKDAHGGVCPD